MKNLTKKISYAIYIVLVAVFITSCNDGKPNLSNTTTNIDGCEYLVSINAYGNSMTHKGSCINPIHKCNCN